MRSQRHVAPARRRAAGAAAVLALLAAGAPAAARGDGFEPELYNLATGNVQPGAIPSAAELRRLGEGGADAVRVAIKMSWHSECTAPTSERLLGGVRPRPEPWADLDALVGNADEAEVELVGLLVGYPSPCVADRPGSQAERSPDAWARWLREVAARYGPGGAFWAGDADPHPVTSWEVANEPNNRAFWSSLAGYSPSDGRERSLLAGPDPNTRPEAQDFASYGCVTQALLKQGNPRVEIVSGSATKDADRYMGWAYDAGAGTCFDVYAYHAYPKNTDGIRRMADRLVRTLEEAQRTKARHGDGSKPTWITEFGFGSPGTGPIDRPRLVGTPTQQAEYVREAYRALKAEAGANRLARAFWFSHQDEETPPPDWADRAGLFAGASRGSEPKPAWSSFAAEARGVAGAGPLE